MDKNPSLLIQNIDWLVTMDADRRVLRDAWVHITGNTVAALGEDRRLPPRPIECWMPPARS